MEELIDTRPDDMTPEEEAEILEELRAAWEALIEEVAAEIETPEGAYED